MSLAVFCFINLMGDQELKSMAQKLLWREIKTAPHPSCFLPQLALGQDIQGREEGLLYYQGSAPALASLLFLVDVIYQ